MLSVNSVDILLAKAVGTYSEVNMFDVLVVRARAFGADKAISISDGVDVTHSAILKNNSTAEPKDVFSFCEYDIELIANPVVVGEKMCVIIIVVL